MPAANTDTMNIQLRDLGQQITDTVQVLLVLDQAGWHNSRGLRVPHNITLLPLPPYSPELNPVEMIWRYLRQHYLSNRQYRDHDALFEAGGKAWNALGDEPNRIQSICLFPWIESAINN
jgi:transposase